MANKRGSNNRCLRTLLIKEILYDRTDEEHFLTCGEIMDILDKDYGFSIDRHKVYEDIELLVDNGYDIECVRGVQNKYHVVSREFDNTELRILIDLVESSKSLSYNRSLNLAKKIARLGGTYAADYMIKPINFESRQKTDNNHVYYIIDTVNNAISKRLQIAFKYYKYLEANNKIVKSDSDEYTVSPYRLIMSGDFYYLIGFSEKHKKIVTFRVDRICDVPKVLKRHIVPEPEGFVVDDYINDSFRSFKAEKKQLELSFHAQALDNIIDRFGDEVTDITVRGEVCSCKINVSLSPAFYAWIFGFEGKVKIKGPEDILTEYIKMVSKEMARL